MADFIDFTYKTNDIFTKLSLIILFTFTKNAYYPLLIKMLKCIWFKMTSPLCYPERTLREADVIKNNENTSRVSFTESSKWTVFITFTECNHIDESNMCCMWRFGQFVHTKMCCPKWDKNNQEFSHVHIRGGQLSMDTIGKNFEWNCFCIRQTITHTTLVYHLNEQTEFCSTYFEEECNIFKHE